MGSKIKLAGVIGMALLLAVSTGAYAQHKLRGDDGTAADLAGLSIGAATESLFVGDGGAEFGIGCSNATGNSGGPNEMAVGVTATQLIPPFNLVAFSYNMFTNVSPTLNTMAFRAWAPGASPGATIGSFNGIPFAQGANQTPLPGIQVSTPSFYFGVANAQTNAGFRIGVDSSSGSAGTSFIRAAVCGAGAFLVLDQLGYPGNWVMRAVAENVIPVELETFEIE